MNILLDPIFKIKLVHFAIEHFFSNLLCYTFCVLSAKKLFWCAAASVLYFSFRTEYLFLNVCAYVFPARKTFLLYYK